MKKYILVSFLLLSSPIATAEDSISAAVEPMQVDWLRYLSDADKDDIAIRMAIDHFKKREANGTLYDDIEGEVEVTVPLEIVPVSDSAKKAARHLEPSISSGAGSTRAVTTSSGFVSCNINTENAHAGSGPSGITVKAKSSGNCSYTPNPGGATPPTLTYRLTQVIHLDDYSMIEAASHERIGLFPAWNSSSTQVFAPSCVSGRWAHFNMMFVIPPPGWVVTTGNPFMVGSLRISNVTC